MSLGFVFSALVEFTVIIMLKRRAMRMVISSGLKQLLKKRKIADVANELKSVEGLKDVAEANCKGSKFGLTATDTNKPQGEDQDLEMLRKIDFISSIAYLLGYIFFNICYWAKMLAD